MERLQGNINSCLLEEDYLGAVEDGDFTTIPSLEDTMPFLQMLGSEEITPKLYCPFIEPNFQTLLKLQTWNNISTYNMSKTDELGRKDTALTRQNSLTIQLCQSFQECPCFLPDQVHVPAIYQLESCLLDTREADKPNKESKTKGTTSKTRVLRERKKRKRKRVTKNKENVESQRMVHIAVERNRRRQINDHLNTLRSLMPPYYAQRGDQASIMGGAIDFVKELEQLLVSLETQKRMRQTEAHEEKLLTKLVENWEEEEEALMVKRNMKIEVSQVRSIQNHINLKIHCQRRPGLLLRAIVAMENLRVKVLHLNISSSQSTVLYSFNLKIEEDSKIRSTGEVVAAVHQIFSSMSINEGS